MSNWKTNYPLRSRPETAEQIIKAVAAEYGLAVAEMRGKGLNGRGGTGGIAYAARIEAGRRCIAACIRPQHFAAVVGIGQRAAHRIYRQFWQTGRGPECTRMVAS